MDSFGPDSDDGRLADLQTLIDSKLGALDLDSLLDELLARVRSIISVDTAAVLLLEPGADELVARAASGIEDEVHQGVRVPLGMGFAGRIAARRQSVRLDRVDSTTVSNPILWEKGIHSMLGVPLLRGDEVLGVLHVGRLDGRPFTDGDEVLLQVAGDRIAGAIQTRQLADERAATGLLERSLLPTKLPNLPGLAFATRYVAAEHMTIGGDWYDIFTVPSGRLWIVMGDVAGHGLNAAVVMGRIRSALRAYSLLDESPERVLDLVDRKVNHFELGAMVTVACAVLDPPYDTMRIALAGHPPPVIASPRQPAALAEVEPSPPIGAQFPFGNRRSTTIPLAPDSVVAFYTDGLIERRGESLDVGFSRLRQAMSLGAPETVARDIMRHVIGQYVPQDDIALVVMHRGPSPVEDAASAPNTVGDLERYVEPVREHLDDVVKELTAGRKRTHWMWFVFPQLRALGRSEMARRYGLADLDEARRFLMSPELGPTYERFVAIVHDVVVRQGLLVHDVFGSPDDVKLVSSLTLFQVAADREARTELAERCRELLDVAERQGLPRCPVTIAALKAAG
ncbi:MAG: SpoIIE family protein phosphatase [Ilumatobacteraceae bacterium]|nr:SpoIIE family protein phosphatase [Ilumatobacteraceae bacterium]